MRRKFLLILGVCFIVVGASLFLAAPVCFILPEAFQSTARIQITAFPPAASHLNDGDPGLRSLLTELEIIQSKAVLHQVITNLSLGKKWAEKFKEEGDLRMEVCYGLIKSNLRVQRSKNTSLIEITFTSDDKMEAAIIANEIARVYREFARSKMPKTGPAQTPDAGALRKSPVEVIDPAEPVLRPTRNAARDAIGFAVAGFACVITGATLCWRSSRKRSAMPPPL